MEPTLKLLTKNTEEFIVTEDCKTYFHCLSFTKGTLAIVSLYAEDLEIPEVKQ